MGIKIIEKLEEKIKDLQAYRLMAESEKKENDVRYFDYRCKNSS